jgi:hypothetical protein
MIGAAPKIDDPMSFRGVENPVNTVANVAG